MTENEPSLKPIDFSEQRDILLNEILYFFLVLNGSKYVADKPRDTATFAKYTTVDIYDGRKAAFDRDHIAPNAGVAASVLQKPIAVFLEIYGTPDTREQTAVETFVGIVKTSGRARRLAIVRTNQGVALDVTVATGESNAANWKVLKDVRGIPSFSVAFP